MMKTTKSYGKRLKLTKNGKLIGRRSGQNHFNAKERSRASMSKRRTRLISTMKNKAKSRFLVNM